MYLFYFHLFAHYKFALIKFTLFFKSDLLLKFSIVVDFIDLQC